MVPSPSGDGYYNTNTRGQRRGWSRGRGRGRWTRGRGDGMDVKAELDAQLDQYMTNTE